MPSLSMSAWCRYEPPIPGNLDLPPGERFFLELAAGLPKLRLLEMSESMRAASGFSELASAMRGVIRMGSIPLSLDGSEISSMEAYVEAVLGQAGTPLWQAMQERLIELNSVGGARELFCERRSGGIATTPDQSSAQKTGAP